MAINFEKSFLENYSVFWKVFSHRYTSKLEFLYFKKYSSIDTDTQGVSKTIKQCIFQKQKKTIENHKN